MKFQNFLADILTFSRILLALILLAMAFNPASSLAAAFVIFLLGELTDAFDGTLAMKFPFPKDHTPGYRKFAAVYDMLADALLAGAMALFFILRVNLALGLTVMILYVVAAIAIDFIVYGRLLGHPDTAKPGSLILKNFKKAKNIILTRRVIYVALITFIAAYTLFFSEWQLVTKVIITVIGLIVLAFVGKFESQRLNYISRDAVDIEKKLAKESEPEVVPVRHTSSKASDNPTDKAPSKSPHQKSRQSIDGVRKQSTKKSPQP